MALNFDPVEEQVVGEYSQIECGAEVPQEVFYQALQSRASEFLVEGICILIQYWYEQFLQLLVLLDLSTYNLV